MPSFAKVSRPEGRGSSQISAAPVHPSGRTCRRRACRRATSRRHRVSCVRAAGPPKQGFGDFGIGGFRALHPSSFRLHPWLRPVAPRPPAQGLAADSRAFSRSPSPPCPRGRAVRGDVRRLAGRRRRSRPCWRRVAGPASMATAPRIARVSALCARVGAAAVTGGFGGGRHRGHGQPRIATRRPPRSAASRRRNQVLAASFSASLSSRTSIASRLHCLRSTPIR